MRKYIIAAVASIFVLGAGSFTVVKTRERARIREEQRKSDLIAHHLHELNKMFGGTLSEEEQRTIALSSNTPEQLRDAYVAICKRRTAFWNGKAEKWLSKHKEVTRLYDQLSEAEKQEEGLVQAKKTFNDNGREISNNLKNWEDHTKEYELYEITK